MANKGKLTPNKRASLGPGALTAASPAGGRTASVAPVNGAGAMPVKKPKRSLKPKTPKVADPTQMGKKKKRDEEDPNKSSGIVFLHHGMSGNG